MGAREDLAVKRTELERLELDAELEEALAEAKDSGDEDAIREASLALRDHRFNTRKESAEARAAAAGEGDAVVQAPVVAAKTRVEKPK